MTEQEKAVQRLKARLARIEEHLTHLRALPASPATIQAIAEHQEEKQVILDHLEGKALPAWNPSWTQFSS